MSERLWRSAGDLEDSFDELEDRAMWPVPGKVATTSRLPARAQATVVLRMARDANGVADNADAAVDRAAGSSGSALPADLQARFEQSLGADLSSVRVHTGGASAQAAQAVGALAYTTGQDIHFGAGHYDPSSAFGVHLIAHEVAHTVQQQGAPATRQHKLEVSAPQDSAEVEADRAADAMVAGQQAQVSAGPAVAARKPAPATKIKVTVVAPVKAGNPIVFDAANYRELYKQVSDRAQTSKCAGQCDCGKIDCNYVTKGTTGTPEEANDVVAVTFTTQITTSTPTWTQKGTQPKPDQQKFDTWVASVRAHEAQHVKIYTDGLNRLKTEVTGKTPEDCDAQVGAIETEIKGLQDQFDANKATQPAPLPAPGGTTKIGPDGKETPVATEAEPAEPAEPAVME